MKTRVMYSRKIKHYNRIFRATVDSYRAAVDFFICVCLEEWAAISVQQSSKARMNLLEAIQKEAARQGIFQDILLEVNIGNEESKSGFQAGEVLPLLEHIADFPNIRVKGLMAIPPISQNPGDNHNNNQRLLKN